MFKIKNIAMNSSGMLNQVNFLHKKHLKLINLKIKVAIRENS